MDHSKRTVAMSGGVYPGLMKSIGDFSVLALFVLIVFVAL
jgi:hypothetical protein